MTENSASTDLKNSETRYTDEERLDLKQRRLSVMNAIPIGVPLDREEVERFLKAREAEQEAEREGRYHLDAALGMAPILWDARDKATRHLLAAGSWVSLDTLRDVLLSHVRANGELWQAAVLETEEEQVRTLSREVPARDSKTTESRLLLVVDRPESQEVLSLLTAFAIEARVDTRVNLAVLTEAPAAIPSALLRHLGYRVCFKATRSDSRDMVGDDSAATLPWAMDFPHAAVVYEEWLGNDPEHGTHRVDLPGRLYGRRRDLYMRQPPTVPAPEGGK